MKTLKLLEYTIYAVMALAALAGCQGKQGPTGAQGQSGPQGIPGVQGSQGQVGPAGANGSDGTQITVVQFCPGVTPSYPSTFPEVGLCINGQIYAVYSANDGFLTLITNGTYNSNAVGSACTFTVSGCTVSQ